MRIVLTMILAFFVHIGTSEKKKIDAIPLIGKKRDVIMLPGSIMKIITMR